MVFKPKKISEKARAEAISKINIKAEDLMAKEKADPTYIPMYCAMYPGLAKIVRNCGYALAIHGSLQRDFDLVCIPWVAHPAESHQVVDEILKVYALRVIGYPEIKEHGREAWTLSIGFGECFLDLSFMPLTYQKL